jgi:predicted phage baseplate assembly protein
LDEVWVHWQEMPDFYSSGPDDRHYTLDHVTGQIRFGDGVHGRVPPVGQNNIRLAFYRSGGGPQGNRAAETIIQLKSTLPYIDSVINYEPALGGALPESLASVKRYGPRTLRHRSRAITAADIEDLAFAASFNVARARAVPPRFRPFDLWLEPTDEAPSFAQHEDVEEAGRYGLIIVPKSEAARPLPSPDLLRRVRTKLLSQMGVTAHLWVSCPEWMEVTVAVTLVPVSLTAADYVSDLVTAALERFLHPLTGGYEGKGWQFGRRPYLSDLYGLIEAVPGVDHVAELSISEAPEVATLSPEQFLIYSGLHEITVILGS